MFGTLLAGVLIACGGGAPEPETADGAVTPAAKSGEVSTPAPAAPAPETTPEATDIPAKPAPASSSSAGSTPPAESAPDAATAPRNIKYVVTPEGLKIEVAGVRFVASAQTKQVGPGWGIQVTVQAEPTDGKSHVLLDPKNGPLAFAAAVVRKGQTEAERGTDTREGDGQKTIDGPTTIRRDWPAKGGRPLAIGETLDLDVGLWGLGESESDRRPVKQFFHVRMKVEPGKPRPIVEPPAAFSK